jgi:hypothetical protein
MLKFRFSDALLWKDEQAQEGDNVRHPSHLERDSESLSQGDLASGQDQGGP